ncbi:hypothetical protein [uncultured Dokdonia sp.]|uniref:hypothetical protein n=1 Tax=uncultured Dokdonia sp. TaxID=575653 RepID=UPI00260D9C05|nr:hypothetical protein [uncultured Dokdonia sp.]
MTFLPFKINETEQSLEIFNEGDFDIIANFKTNGYIVESLKIDIKNTDERFKYEPINGHICCDVIEGNKFHFLDLNFILVKKPVSDSLYIPTNPTYNNPKNPDCRLKIDIGSILFTRINIYGRIDEIVPCLNIFGNEFQPETIDGKIIIGTR